MQSASRSQASTALRRLMTEYSQLQQSTMSNSSKGTGTGTGEEPLFLAGPISENNFFIWECLIHGPIGTPFEGGVFCATLEFPKEYPLMPPKMKFHPPLFHPNIYTSGEVCISILHPPGDDPNMYESSSERWSPVQSVEKILLSVVSMLAEPNVESGANVDASKLFRTDETAYANVVRQNVRLQLGLGPEPKPRSGKGKRKEE